MNEKFLSCMEAFARDYPGVKLALAVSGGADSMALLHWLKQIGADIDALTVDHGLRPESAAEAAAVGAECRRLGIRHETLEWSGPKPETGIEEAAREARYGLMFDWCRKNGVKILCTAHHADDQIETFFINLSRGSGVYGLSGMRERLLCGGMVLLRPLLGVPKSELRDFCDRTGVRYFDDPMNEDERFLRVKIRKARRMLPISDDRILLAIENLARARDALNEEVGSLAARIIGSGADGFEAALLLDRPDEIKFRVLSMALGAGRPVRLDEVRGAFARLGAGDCRFTLGGRIISRRGAMITMTEEK
ncbi:MAG: tRNA lysidine(34) synthetase TilS [Rickettsiales bacterium]|jgi:tRNA(Ile)-lysidine synthase|nr:tRNA lysidine(34) synthetase TilS [Rickettsiales bacterium]